MIVSVTEAQNFVPAVLKISDNNPFACRILSLYRCYPPELAFVDYWMTADENGICTGAIARNGSNFILFLTEKSELDEIASFLRISGASAVLCDGGYNLDFSDRITQGIVMKITHTIDVDIEDQIIEPDIRSAYDLIVKCTDENFAPPEFEDFYVDVNHKLRHKAMRLCGIYDGEVLAAIAMTVAESSDGAVLGAVACHPDYRRSGYGSKIVSHLTNALITEGKAVYLHRAQNANAAFYQKLGFENCGSWREYR